VRVKHRKVRLQVGQYEQPHHARAQRREPRHGSEVRGQGVAAQVEIVSKIEAKLKQNREQIIIF
jgi:hypothetical protein